VEAATAKLSKADRRAGRQVTVVPLPPSQNFNVDYSRSFDNKMDRAMDDRSREFDRKMERKLNKAARKLDKSAKPYVYGGPAAGRRADRAHDIHIEIDEAALNRLANNAVALGNVSLNLGLEAAAQGIEEARRELEATLRDPHLDAEARRQTKQALRGLDRERAKNHGGERPEPPERPEAPEGPGAEERAEEVRSRTEEQQARRQEIQERIREAQDELRELEETRRETGEIPAAPRPPRAPRVRPVPPQGPPAPPAPVRSTEVRDELRRDGLIGPNEKSFSFQLDDKGGRVNGRALTPAQAAKYRRLFQPAATGKGNTKSTISISVDER